MDRVDAMKKLQGWTDTSVLHFRNLGCSASRSCSSIRFGSWSDVHEPEQASNWARFLPSGDPGLHPRLPRGHRRRSRGRERRHAGRRDDAVGAAAQALA